MLVAVAIIPSAPVLVPELVGTAADELAELREAVLTAAKALPPRWIAIGTAATDQVWGPESAGTFAGYGVDTRIALGPGADNNVELPLSALLTGWVRGQVRPEAHAQVRCLGAEVSPSQALARGRVLRTELAGLAEPVGVLVVADGCNTLTPSAPGGHDPESVPVQSALDAALAGGDVAALAELPESVLGRPAFAMLAGLCGPAPQACTQLYCGAPFGVGYNACVWQP